ncbi:MAG: helix-turn-helix domain-containing protein [Thermoplasmata archaeon]|nr:helix-turn-helix domain-containing protein [Thermoplasmata archaeon]
MKIPCEVVVWQVLPLIRRELARELVTAHGMTQAEVAKRFGVTDAAISQYLTQKRGGEYSSSRFYPQFIEEVRASAARIAEEDADFGKEVCYLCGVVKKIGFLAEIYQEKTGCPPPKCEEVFSRR